MNNQFVKAVACGENHSVALIDENWMYFWGSNLQGQCGLNGEMFSVLLKP